MKNSNSNSDSSCSAHLNYVKLLCLLSSPFIFQYLFLSSDALFLVLLTGSIAFVYLDSKPRPTYLLDFACYRPPNHLKISDHEFIKLAKKSGNINEKSVKFQGQVLESSGIGDNASLEDCREEVAAAMFGPIDDVLAATAVSPAEIGILVVNCGGLNTTPSLASMVVNRYKLGSGVQSFNLGGMGCSAGVAAVEAARDLLAAHPSVTYALVVTAEVHVPSWLPRPGATAVLLSGARRLRARAKYELIRNISTKFKHTCMAAVGKEVVEGAQAELGLSDRQMEASRKTFERFGNISSCSLWYELAYLEYVDKVKDGDRVRQVAFESGIKRKTLLWKALGNNKASSHSPWC